MLCFEFQKINFCCSRSGLIYNLFMVAGFLQMTTLYLITAIAIQDNTILELDLWDTLHTKYTEAEVLGSDQLGRISLL